MNEEDNNMLKTAYQAVIAPAAEGYCITVPQFGIQETADTQAEAIQKARETLCSRIVLCEDTRGESPLPAAVPAPEGDPDALITLIDIDMEAYRALNGTQAVRKNCTIPQWLDIAARKKNINFSQVLQDALARELDLQ